jgi:hypothetical protein
VEQSAAKEIFVVIDDSQRLGPPDWAIEDRLPLVAERLQSLALEANAAVLAVWPDLRHQNQVPQVWGERVPAAHSVLVLRNNSARSGTTAAPWSAVTLNVVQNRGGEKGAIGFDFQPEVATFKELPPGS